MRREIPRGGGGRCAKIVVALAACLALGWTGIGGAVDRSPDAARQLDTRQRIAELEKTFWQCEQAAGAGTIDIVMAAHCDAITDELKKRKFGGDDERMLQWWRQNKLAGLPRAESGPGAEPSA